MAPEMARCPRPPRWATGRTDTVGFAPTQRAELRRRWWAAMPAGQIAGWDRDLLFYDKLERLQLALLNLPRHAEASATPGRQQSGMPSSAS
jgi:hypothetical protein